MPRAVSVAEAKDRLDALLDEVAAHGAEVVVERRGKPEAVLIPVAAYRDLAALRDRRNGTAASALLECGADGVRARNGDLTEDQAIALADRIPHEIVDDLAARGDVTVERDRR